MNIAFIVICFSSTHIEGDDWYHDHNIEGVFATEELANAYISKQPTSHDDEEQGAYSTYRYEVQKWTVATE